MKKALLIGLLVIVIAIQFFRPAPNNGSLDTGKGVSAAVLLQKMCRIWRRIRSMGGYSFRLQVQACGLR
jgi:hypothetical protein